MDASDPFTFLALKRGVLRERTETLSVAELTLLRRTEYVQLKPLLVIVTFILKATGTYKDGSLEKDAGCEFAGRGPPDGRADPFAADTYVSIAYNLSVSISLYSLAMFWVATGTDLKPYRPMPKVSSRQERETEPS